MFLAAYVWFRSLLYIDSYADLRLIISFQSKLKHLWFLHIYIWSWYSDPFSPSASKSPVSILFIRGRQQVLLNWTILWPSEGKCQLGLWARKIQFFFQGKTWFSLPSSKHSDHFFNSSLLSLVRNKAWWQIDNSSNLMKCFAVGLCLT